MDLNTVTPVFDFSNPWVALIQLSLVFILPTLVGLITDKLTASVLKVALLGGTTFAATLLTSLLDATMAGSPFDWLNAVANGLITWALAIVSYTGILKPAGVIAMVQRNHTLQIFGPSLKSAEQQWPDAVG